jgi:hypothetical protein
MISQKRMAFLNSHIPFPPTQLNPGSCQAARIEAALSKPIVPMTMTREESELKQLAYERERALWRKENGINHTY